MLVAKVFGFLKSNSIEYLKTKCKQCNQQYHNIKCTRSYAEDKMSRYLMESRVSYKIVLYNTLAELGRLQLSMHSDRQFKIACLTNNELGTRWLNR